jgi:hypothetical protein
LFEFKRSARDSFGGGKVKVLLGALEALRGLREGRGTNGRLKHARKTSALGAFI